MISLTFKETGYRQAADRAGKRVRVSTAETDRLVMRSGSRLVDLLREEAPKKSGLFAEGIQADHPGRVTRTAWGAPTLDTIVRGDHAWLAPLILHGTKPHEIPKGGAAAQRAKGYPLRFYWENGPYGPGIYRYWSVWHPGTKANPFPDRAFDRWRPEAEDALQNAGVAIAQLRHTA